MIKKAKRRILISALYIGTEQGELVGELDKSSACVQRLFIIVDHAGR